ncbi:hypothetical protein NliqN6_0199 [Naganishia liquefaciens]|uniref:SDR family oxidoreductase n=1 Tax=Naganishia liquefaciens TaxID=104408 RepID=A0A8H3TMI4_9TREE|nr:hypothetical protein NliqN6_0199 [Naganishia liquefaciens]
MSPIATGVSPSQNGTADLNRGEQVVDLAVASQNQGQALADVPALDLFSLAGKAVIVTGGARGLGLCIGTALLEAKCGHVYCCDVLPEPNVEEWARAKQAAKKYGGSISYTQLDITNVDAVNSTFEKIYDESEYEVSGLLAAAGIQQMVPSLEYPAADFRRIMDVNVAGTFFTIQAAARQMVKHKIAGSIAIIASMSGSIANKGLTCLAYNTSKAALLQMCRSAAAEWGQHRIRVNTLSPGYIRTAMTDQLLEVRPDLEEEWLRGSMLNRLSTPDEFRGPVLFLLSKASSFTTGADLIVDGGHTAY